MNRMTRHVSVDRQIVIRTCAKGCLKYHKYLDIEVEETMEKWMAKKLVATTVSSRILGIKRRREGTTVSSHGERRCYAKIKKIRG